MPTTKQFVLVPRQGRGIVSARSPQVLSEYTDSFSFLWNLFIKDGAWELRGSDNSAALIPAATGPVWAIHYYNALNPAVSGATSATTYLILSGETTSGSGSSTLYRSDTGVAVTVNGVNFTTSGKSDAFFLNIKNRCFVVGNTLDSGVVPTIITRYPSAASYPWGKAGGTADLTYDAFTNATNTTTLVYYATAGGGVTATTTVTKTAGAAWDAGTAWVGKTVKLNEVDYTIVSYTPTTGPMTISPTYAGAVPASVNIRVQYGELSWPNGGPSYAYAYYNPSTGHMTNRSPVMTISENTISNVRVALRGIPLTGDANYTRVCIFRTNTQNGGTLIPLKLDPVAAALTGAGVDVDPASAGIGMLINTPAGTVDYPDYVSDNALGKILGAVQAPETNNPPPVDAKLSAFWDGRVWLVSAATPYRVNFSAIGGAGFLGVPEECFPAGNYRDISSDDSTITSLKVVGSSLLIGSEKYLYTVDGSDEGTYRLTRISSRGGGIDQFAIDEHPGDSSEQSASAIYVARDKRLWRQYPAGRIEDIGWPIQDKLDKIDLTLKRPVVVKVAQVKKSWLLCVGIREQSPQPRYGWLFYDFDEQSWLDLNFGTAALWWSNYGGYANFTWSGITSGIDYNGFTSGIPALDIGMDGVGIQRIRVTGLDGDGMQGAIDTQFLDLGDKTAKKTFQDVVIHTNVTDSSFLPVIVQFDDGGPTGGGNFQALGVQDVIGTPRLFGERVFRFQMSSATAQNTFHTIKLAIGLNGLKGKKIFKVAMNYTIESTGISGTGN